MQRYSRLVMAVIRRYIPNRGDEARSLHADVLKLLHGGGLARYAGRPKLDWKFAVLESDPVGPPNCPADTTDPVPAVFT